MGPDKIQLLMNWSVDGCEWTHWNLSQETGEKEV
jgi:hypothetical protein